MPFYHFKPEELAVKEHGYYTEYDSQVTLCHRSHRVEAKPPLSV
jgi:hypothetical protein